MILLNTDKNNYINKINLKKIQKITNRETSFKKFEIKILKFFFLVLNINLLNIKFILVHLFLSSS